MARLELARLALFVVEWVLSATCLGVFPSSLYRITTGDDNVTTVHVCAIGGSAFCQFGIAWTTAAFLILTICIGWHLSEYCTRFALPALLEVAIVSVLAAWWLVMAIACAVAKLNISIVDVTSSSRKFIRSCSWVLVVLFIISAVIAWCVARDEEASRQEAFSYPVQAQQPEDFPMFS